MSGFIFNLNRARSISIYNDATSQFKIDNNLMSLEDSLGKAAKISNDDSSYRQLSAFYVQKAQHILTNTKNTEEAQKEFVAAANNAVKSAQTAVSINKYNYNNYIALGSAHELQSIIDKDASYIHAREAYNAAKELYKNNPYISLTLAKLEWSNKKNSTSTINKIGESLQIKQNYSPAYYLLSQLSVQNNDKVSAEKYALQAIQSDETNVDAYLQYGILTLNNKNLPEAELAFLSVLKKDPSNLNAIYYLATTYITSQKYDTAQELINALNIKLPNSEEVKDLQKYLNQSKNPTTTTAAKKKSLNKK
jgi:tetratricopeptide (TPR) repeat protein